MADPRTAAPEPPTLRRAAPEQTALRRAALEQTMLLGALADDVLDELAAAGTLRHYGRGQPVVVAGDPGGDLLVVAAGRLKVVARSPEGVDLVLAVAAVGDTVGELSLLDGAPRSATVEAAEDASVLWLPAGSPTSSRSCCASRRR
jgi:CRP/FNR family cyclic AMP-dependent transcriptional regulator